MTEEEIFDDIYMQAESGFFDKEINSYGIKKIRLDPYKMTEACKEYGVDFGIFIKYAQQRKSRENNENK